MSARNFFLGRVLGGVMVGGLAVLAALPAQAGDVHWSVGVQAPGIGATVSNSAPMFHVAPPVVMYPGAVIVQPVPVRPPPVYHLAPPRVVYAPAPVYYMAPGAVQHPHWHSHRHPARHGHGWSHGKGKWRH